MGNFIQKTCRVTNFWPRILCRVHEIKEDHVDTLVVCTNTSELLDQKEIDRVSKVFRPIGVVQLNEILTLDVPSLENSKVDIKGYFPEALGGFRKKFKNIIFLFCPPLFPRTPTQLAKDVDFYLKPNGYVGVVSGISGIVYFEKAFNGRFKKIMNNADPTIKGWRKPA